MGILTIATIVSINSIPSTKENLFRFRSKEKIIFEKIKANKPRNKTKYRN